jgi:hypothetical protein
MTTNSNEMKRVSPPTQSERISPLKAQKLIEHDILVQHDGDDKLGQDPPVASRPKTLMGMVLLRRECNMKLDWGTSQNVEIIMERTHVSREVATDLLIKNNGDIVHTILQRMNKN